MVFERDIQVGTIDRAEIFEDCKKPKMFKLWVNIEGSLYQSAAQLAYNHSIEEVEGSQVLCVTDLDSMSIAGFKSEVLTVGVPDENGNPVLVKPDEVVPNGGQLY